jgi:hypothetical protein
MARLNIDAFENFFIHYQALPHQKLAIAELWKAMPVSLLEDDADWVEQYRDAATEEPDVPVLTGKEVSNSWGGILAAAKHAGAKFPEVVSAQWALESGWGKHTSGTFNVFGIKGEGSDCVTWEHFDGKDIVITDSFKNYDSIQECVNDLVTMWYMDYKGFNGVNRAESREECARLLVVEKYATDPKYADKLIKIMHDQDQLG